MDKEHTGTVAYHHIRTADEMPSGPFACKLARTHHSQKSAVLLHLGTRHFIISQFLRQNIKTYLIEQFKYQ